MDTVTPTWPETVALFERRGFPSTFHENLDEGPYALLPRLAALPGSLALDGNMDQQLNPRAKADTDEEVAGYIVDGDLTVDGNILNLDDGCPALVVLGDLRAANIMLSGDAHLLVAGSVEVETFIGVWTDKLVEIHGDLRSTLTILEFEFCLDRVGGCLYGRALTPECLNLTDEQNIDRLEDPAPNASLADLLVPEILVSNGDAGNDGDLPDLGILHGRLVDRLRHGAPLIRGGRHFARPN